MRNGNSSINFFTITVAGAALSVFACANAVKDYDTFREKTADFRDASSKFVVDSGPPPEASIPTEEFKGTFIALCHIKSLYPEEFSKTLRFKTGVVFTPAAGGAGGDLALVLEPIKAYQASSTELNFDIALVSVASGQYKGTSAVAAADGAFEMTTDAAGKKLASDTNTLGVEAAITEISLKGYATDLKKGFCALINADTSFLKLPYAGNNVCLFLPATPGTQFTPVPGAAGDFHCP